MTRMRITVRGDGTELRGYATMEALVSLTSPPGEQPYIVTASPADDDYNPFAISEPENPPTLEKSIDVLTDIAKESSNLVEVIERFAAIHYGQAMVIRGERGRAERAEAELVGRELHHFETEQIIERIQAARSNHPPLPVCQKHPDEQDAIKCGWRSAVEDIDKVLADVPE